jgi:hypothetical protein
MARHLKAHLMYKMEETVATILSRLRERDLVASHFLDYLLSLVEEVAVPIL